MALKSNLKQQIFLFDCIACFTNQSTRKVSLGPLQTTESS